MCSHRKVLPDTYSWLLPPILLYIQPGIALELALAKLIDQKKMQIEVFQLADIQTDKSLITTNQSGNGY